MKFGPTIPVLLVLLSIIQCKEPLPTPNISCASLPSPADGAFVPVGSSVELSWLKGDAAHTYDVYMRINGGLTELVAHDLALPRFNYQVSNDEGASYTWLVEGKGDGALGCPFLTGTFTAKALPPIDDTPIEIDVLVLNYDPDMQPGSPNRRLLHEFYGWQDPHELANAYIADLLDASDGIVKYNIVEWRDMDDFPVKKDGFRYTPTSYIQCKGSANAAACHSPDDLDYSKVIAEQKVAEKITNGEIDELWIFGAPYFGFWESAMAGPKAFYINGGVFPDVQSSKPFAIMGFSYERGPAEMIHNLCHRTEATMSLVYGGWHAEELSHSWARFAANQKQSGTAAVGTCHWPPNAESEYDYGNTREVLSTADDWLNYPYLTGTRHNVSAMTWISSGPNPDDQRDYLRWWFSHLPRREGVAADGKLNNWWRYVYEFDETVVK